MAVKAIDYSKCIDCRKCYDICPNDVYGVFSGKVFVRYPKGCASCSLCIMQCPKNACQINVLRPVPLPSRQNA